MLYIYFKIFCITNSGISSPFFVGSAHTPGLRNKVGFSGNTINAEGIKVKTGAGCVYIHSCFPFTGMLSVSHRIKESVGSTPDPSSGTAVSTSLLHFCSQETASFQDGITWEHTFCLCNFPVLTVQSFYDICCIHNSADISGKLKERAHIFPVVFPVTDRIGIFLSPFFFNHFQFPKEAADSLGAL